MSPSEFGFQSTRWTRWANRRIDEHKKANSVSVAPRWLYAKGPATGLRILAEDNLRRCALKWLGVRT